MQLEQLKKEAERLIVQRAGLKDQLEQVEKVLGNLSFTIQVMEANKPEPAPEAGDLGEMEVEVS